MDKHLCCDLFNTNCIPFEKLGIAFIDAFSGIVVAMLFVSVPFLVDAAREGFKEVAGHEG
jgi:molybdate/tungstate transport system permease protein